MIAVPYELFIALRYLRAKRKQVVISVITLIAIGAVAAGVASLIIVLSMMTGFREEFQTKILSGTAHLNLLRKDGQNIQNSEELVERLAKLRHIRSASPTLYQRVLIQGTKDTDGAILKGVDMNAPPAMNEIFQFTVAGDPQALAASDTDAETGASIDNLIIGQDLAQAIGLKVGDIATIISPQGHLTPVGMSPRYRDFKVVGLFASGLADYDATWAYISIDAAKRLSGSQDVVQLIQIKVDDVDEVKRIGSEVLAAMGDEYTVQDWQELNAPIYTALSYEKLLSGIALLIVIGIAALNIITVLIMIVMEKQRDIAILKSMGATHRSVMWVFMLQGVLIGVVGLLIGLIAGTAFCSLANAKRLIKLPPGAYALDYLPFHVNAADILIVALVTLLISFASTIYPAWSASRLNPVEGLRYE
jgi:lipoprotein-releasing system permease protein